MANDPRPNILLISTDQQRYDTLSCTGSSWIRTPHLDGLARRGTIFQRAYIQNSVCIPSRACLQTGRYPRQHGVDYMEEVIDETPGLPPWERTFMEELQGAGYHSAAFGKIHMMPEKGFHEKQVTGGKGARWTRPAGQAIGLGPLGRDYAAWLERRHAGAYEAIYEARRKPGYQKYATALPFPLPLEAYVDYWCAGNTIEFIRRAHDRPFFAWCGFCGPHPPIDPPAPYDTMYAPDDVPLPPNYALDKAGHPRRTRPEQDAVARRFWAYYAGLVTLIDDQIGRILEALQESGRFDETLVLFTSDHGEMGFEFGRTGKGVFYEAVLRVPLIVKPPAADGAPKQRSCGELVEMFDLAPTALDYARAAIPARMSAASLRPLLEGRGAGKESVFCEFVSSDRRRKGVCVRTKRYKYVHWKGEQAEQFFDLEADPLERKNLAGHSEARGPIEQHRRLLLERLMEH